jgi:hypothetical protein
MSGRASDRFAMRAGALIVTLLLGGGLATATASADDELGGPVQPPATSTEAPPPPSEPAAPPATATESGSPSGTAPAEPAPATAVANQPPAPAAPGPADESPVTQAVGAFGGVIFKDGNLNGVMDAEETGLAGVLIQISGGDPFGNFEHTTDQAGRFSFGDIPTGDYFVDYGDGSEPGWVVSGLTGSRNERITIDESGQLADVRIPATRRLGDSLQITFTFDRASYRPGDTVRATVVLSNFGPVPLPLAGVMAHCDDFPSPANLRGGEGWGPLDPAGVGLSIPARGFRLVTVAEPLPAGAVTAGQVTASCRFGATGYPRAAGLRIHHSASVASDVTGSGRGRIGLAADPSQPAQDLPGVTVVITHPDTGALVSEVVTDEQGRFGVDDVPAGIYDLRVAGPYQPQGFSGGWFAFLVRAEGTFEQFYAVVPGPDEVPPNLKVSAAFDKPEYTSADRPRVRITVTNIGAAAAEHVHVRQGGLSGSMFIDERQFGEFGFGQPGAHIGVGETRVLEVTGSFFDPRHGVLIYRASFTGDKRDLNVTNDVFTLAAPVTVTFGDYAGLVFGDEDRDGMRDPGEELPGASVSLTGAPGSTNQITNAEGRFAFTGVMTGGYRVNVSLEGWNLVEFQVHVTETAGDAVEIRLVRPLSASLSVSMAFTRGTYDVGDTAQVLVTLTNTGRNVLEHVRARCFSAGEGLRGTGPGWRPLRAEDAGVTLAPGRTMTLVVSEAVPQEAPTVGFVSVGCDFRIGSDPSNGNPFGFDTANVAQLTGTAQGRLVQEGSFTGIPNTEVLLIDPRTGRRVARAVTDTDGNFDIPNVPTRHYTVRVVGPWQPGKFESMQLLVFRNDGERRFIVLKPGQGE